MMHSRIVNIACNWFSYLVLKANVNTCISVGFASVIHLPWSYSPWNLSKVSSQKTCPPPFKYKYSLIYEVLANDFQSDSDCSFGSMKLSYDGVMRPLRQWMHTEQRSRNSCTGINRWCYSWPRSQSLDRQNMKRQRSFSKTLSIYWMTVSGKDIE